jgi:predicted permease
MTLALAVGVNTALFSVVNALSFKPIPGVNVDRVSQIGYGWSSLTVGQLRQLERTPPQTIVAVAGARELWDTTVQVPGRAEQLSPYLISGSLSRVFGLTAQVGRWIEPEDDVETSAGVVVISDRMWREWFGASREVIGRVTIHVNKQTFTVIGVALPEFRGLSPMAVKETIWLPLASAKRVDRLLSMPNQVADEQQTVSFVKARPEASAGAVQDSVQFVFPPRVGPGPPGRPRILIPAGDALRRSSLGGIESMLMIVAVLIFVAACANLTNMLFARGLRRAGEIGVRLTLGASAGRLFRLLFAEVAVISGLAVAAGFSIAGILTRLLASTLSDFRPSRYETVRMVLDLSLDHRVLLFACAAGVIATALVGALTAWRTSRLPLLRTLASAGAAPNTTAQARGVRTALVSVQVTSALLMLLGAGFVHENVRRTLDATKLSSRRVDYDTAHLVTARLDLKLHDYTEPRGRDFYARLVRDLAHVPDVESAALADGVPGDAVNGTMFAAESRSGQVGISRRLNAKYSRVTPGFLATIGLTLRRGRDFSEHDTFGAPPVAIVSDSVAADLWPGEDAIGKRMLFGAVEWLTVVGVVADPAGPFAFVPFAQRYTPGMLVTVRSATPEAVVAPLQAAIRALDNDVAILDAAPAEATLLGWVRSVQATGVLVTSLGALALGIAMLGVYGVVSFFVSSRIREFGIRTALGATPGSIVRMVLDQAVHLLLVGLLPGVFIASVGSRIIENRIFKVMPNEISTWVGVPLIVLMTGLVAGYLPARRAARVDPNVALRDL